MRDSSSSSWVENVKVLVPLVVLGSLAGGSAFYVFVNDWPLSLAFYYATQALFGCMYGVPTETNSTSQVFTLFLYLLGATLCASAIGAFSSHLVSHATLVSSDERRRLRLQSSVAPENKQQQEKTTADTVLHRQTLYHQRSQSLAVAAALGWLLVGTLLWSFFEGKSIAGAAFFALGAMTAAGGPAPVCYNDSSPDPYAIDCWLGHTQALALAFYILVGVPLFTFAAGQWALTIVERAIRADELKTLRRPLTEAELQLVDSLQKSHKAKDLPRLSLGRGAGSGYNGDGDRGTLELDLADFIVLECIRLQKIDEDDLLAIKTLFGELGASASSSSSSSSDSRRAFASSYNAASRRSSPDVAVVDVDADVDVDVDVEGSARLTRSLSSLGAMGADSYNARVLPLALARSGSGSVSGAGAGGDASEHSPLVPQ